MHKKIKISHHKLAIYFLSLKISHKADEQLFGSFLFQLERNKMKLIRNKVSVFLKLEKTNESPLNSKEIKPVHPKENQLWIFSGRTDAEGEGPILWPLDVKKRLWKRLWCWERWGQEEKGATEDEVVGQHYQLNGHELKQGPGDSEGQESLACCSP